MSHSELDTFFVGLGKKNASDPADTSSPDKTAEAVQAFRTNLQSFLLNQGLPEDAVKIEKEYKRFGLVLIECTQAVADLLKQMPGVASVTKNSSKRIS
jgi:hypothetical protein